MSTTARVLVVEDEPDIAGLIEMLLTDEGFEVLVARTGNDALVRIGQQRIDIVLLDLLLPGDRDGFAVLRDLRDQPHPPIIILSAHVQAPDPALFARSYGAVDFIRKPFDTGDLLARIRKALA